MDITTDMAKLLLRQFITRSTLLAPLGTISETCWLIILNLYSSDDQAGQTIAYLSTLMDMPEVSLTRYVAVLKDSGFVSSQTKTTTSGNVRYWLTPETHQTVDDILRTMVQDALSSFGK